MRRVRDESSLCRAQACAANRREVHDDSKGREGYEGFVGWLVVLVVILGYRIERWTSSRPE